MQRYLGNDGISINDENNLPDTYTLSIRTPRPPLASTLLIELLLCHAHRAVFKRFGDVRVVLRAFRDELRKELFELEREGEAVVHAVRGRYKESVR